MYMYTYQCHLYTFNVIYTGASSVHDGFAPCLATDTVHSSAEDRGRGAGR